MSLTKPGNRVRQARRHGTLTQAELATLVGVHRSAVAQWERPGGPNPTGENLARIATSTKVSFEWLATGRGRMTYRSDLLAEEEPAVVVEYAAHGELEIRALAGLRRLDYHQAEATVNLIESLADGRTLSLKRRGPFSR
ncbi:helix-turn-helix transcriptional regulator [soil metagenome]